MADVASTVLASELGKLGGIGARFVARFLPNVPYETSLEFAGSPEEARGIAESVLREIGTARPELPSDAVVTGSGRTNLNPTTVSISVTPSAAGASIRVHAVAKEGLSKQNSSQKATDRVVTLLTHRIDLTRRSS